MSDSLIDDGRERRKGNERFSLQELRRILQEVAAHCELDEKEAPALSDVYDWAGRLQISEKGTR